MDDCCRYFPLSVTSRQNVSKDLHHSQEPDLVKDDPIKTSKCYKFCKFKI